MIFPNPTKKQYYYVSRTQTTRSNIEFPELYQHAVVLSFPKSTNTQ